MVNIFSCAGQMGLATTVNFAIGVEKQPQTTWIGVAVFQKKLFTKTGNDLVLVMGHSLPALCSTSSVKPATPPPTNEAQGIRNVCVCQSPAVN